MSDLPPPSSPTTAPHSPPPLVPPPYIGPPPQIPPPPGWGPNAPSNGMAVAALTLGIVGVVFCFMFVPSVLAIIFGAIAMRPGGTSQASSSRPKAIAGFTLGIVGAVIGIGFWIASGLGAFDEEDNAGGTDDQPEVIAGAHVADGQLSDDVQGSRR